MFGGGRQCVAPAGAASGALLATAAIVGRRNLARLLSCPAFLPRRPASSAQDVRGVANANIANSAARSCSANFGHDSAGLAVVLEYVAMCGTGAMTMSER
jgi:hypothetical protein